MTNNATRLARLRRECDIAAGPVWLLAVARAALVLALELEALLGETVPTLLGQPRRSQDVTLDQWKAIYLACDREAMRADQRLPRA